jgi:hypothetical protein
MHVNIFNAEDYDQEDLVKVVVSLTFSDLTKALKAGEALATDWLDNRGFNCEFRIIVQGRQTGVGKGQQLIDLRKPWQKSRGHCPLCGSRGQDNLVVVP